MCEVQEAGCGRYLLVAFSGSRAMMTGQLMGTQVCGVVTCTRTPDTAGCSLALPGAGGTRSAGHPVFYLLDISVVRDWFRFLTLESRDFAASSLIMPLVLSSSGQLPDWDNIAFSRQQNGRYLDPHFHIYLSFWREYAMPMLYG